jgi:hypothetical protein
MRSGNRVLIAALLAVVAACGNDDGSGPSTGELSGVWRATKVELVSVANSSVKVDLVSMGAVYTLTLGTSGTFTLAGTMPGEPADTRTGTWSASSDVLTLNFAGGSGNWQFDMELSGTTLTLSGANGSYDFNDDDQDEEAKINLVLTRQ